uniref:Ribonuclease A-domain domain-containing protein n=1 Tax=Labrus bergylta TaxID=56723 RepID=A0A3Q3G3Y5_9LABR
MWWTLKLQFLFAWLLLLSFALLLLLPATVLCIPPALLERHKKFINQHVKGEMSVNRCDAEIGSRNIKTINNECKETNTFIVSTNSPIKTICENGMPLGNGMMKSTTPFHIIVCILRNQGARPPHCQYRGQARTNYIAIKCEDGYPVGTVVIFLE